MSLKVPKSLAQFPVGQITDKKIESKFPANGIRHLKIDVKIVGNLLICFDAVEEASVVAAGQQHLIPQRIETIGDTLSISGSNLGAYLRGGQKDKLLTEIHVPKNTNVNISFLAGVVILSGGIGDISVKGLSGEVSGVTESGSVRVALRCGDISLNNLVGKADLRIGLGSITLGWERFRGTEDVQVHCGFGGVDFLLPPGTCPVEESSGFFKKKHMTPSPGASLKASLGFGGLDVLNLGEL